MGHEFRFKNKTSSSFDLIIKDKDVYGGSARDVSFISIPGRNGDLLVDNERLDNETVSYETTILPKNSDIKTIIRKIKSWLQGEVGYFELTDTYDPNYFRLACYNGKIDIEEIFVKIGSAKLNFSCKPFKYSFEGLRKIDITTPTTLLNNEDWNSIPYIKIIGSGDVTVFINDKSYFIESVNQFIELDGEILAAFKGEELQNSKINFIKFPTFTPGDNTISWNGNVTRIEVIPRWCCR